MFSIVVFAAAGIGFTTGAPRVPPDVEATVVQRVELGYCVGLVVGIVDRDGTSYFSRGRLSQDSERPVDEDTIFEIGSMTKAFTGILLADLVERGQVNLDDPVAKFLPTEVKVPSHGDRTITLADLATHRSSLPRLPDNLAPKDETDPYADYTAERLYQFLSGYELNRDIGSRYEYSNLGIGLLGHALARAIGKPYEQLIAERICEPLGLKDTRITLSEEQRSRLAHGHQGDQPIANWNFGCLAGCGALRSSARDMLRFLSANLELNENPLSAALRRSRENRTETGQPDLQAALGWHIWKKYDTEIIWHNGGTGGYHGFCGFVPDKKVGVVVLTNSSEDIDDIGLHFLEPRYELKTPRKPATIQGADLDEYVGYYELQPGIVFHITREGDQLFAQLTGQGKAPVYAESESKFFYKVVDAQLTFNRGEDGKVARLVLHQNGLDQPARKLGPEYKPLVRVEVSVDSSTLARYVGKYELAPGVVLDVILEGGQLKVKLADQPRFPVFAESETKFFYKVVDAQLTFVKDEAGNVTALILHQGGRDQTARKIE